LMWFACSTHMSSINQVSQGQTSGEHLKRKWK
jgi:hypothetical protein